MQPKRRIINVFMLAMINVAAICNIANIAISAEYGFASIFYYAASCLFFFIPAALISAELSCGFSGRGGVYLWVKEALGEKFGFLAIWLQWIENVIWYPTALSFIVATFAYTFNPSLAKNKLFIMLSILVLYWIITYLNLLGMKISSWISTICAVVGTILPGILIISLGVSWLLLNKPLQIEISFDKFFPSFSSLKNFSLLAGILLSLSGIEMSAVHAKDVQNPQKNYARAIFLSVIIIFSILSMGALSIAMVVPQGEISLASGTIEAISTFLKEYNLSKLVPIVAIFMVIGAIGMVSTWIVGPSRGLLATARHGELPPFLQKVNKKGMPKNILLIQAVIVSLLAFVFIYMPTVSSSYWILFCLTAQLYLIMYILLFISGIVLRYKKSNIQRNFKIPFKNFGMLFAGILGILGSSFAIICGFFPPHQIISGNLFFFEGFLIIGILIFCIIPLLIHKMKKKSWHIHTTE